MGAAGGNFAFLCGLAVTLSLFQGAVSQERPVVTLSSGAVRGWRLPSRATQGTYLLAFKGIPYATPPLDTLRFKAPLIVKSWSDVKNLSASEPMACSQNMLQIPGPFSEDCLFVNVYTPEGVNSTSGLPVMVWIHGGAFFGGSSDSQIYGGDYLVEQGVVFVSLNYRLGALGFLNLGTDEVPGNAGLKDQNLALQWVNKEIVNFGGDPNKVTLFGQSAGSASVMLHYLSPKSAGLFRSVIAESGNALAEWAFMATGFDERANALSGKLNCTDANGTVSLTCLQKAKVEDIITYQDVPLTDNEYIPGNSFVFVPSLEKPSNSAMLTDTPENLLTSLLQSNRTKVPLITGVNKDEGIGEVTGFLTYYKELQSKLKYFIPQTVRQKLTDVEIATDAALIYKEYFNNTAPSLTNIDGFVKIYTDKMFALSTAIFARKIVNWTQTYLYHFDYDGNFKQQQATAMQMNYTKGVDHGDEMGYIFARDDLNQSTTPENTTEKKTLRKMVKLWTNFAKYMNPTPVSSESVLGNFTWNPISEGSIHYMRVTTDLFEMSSDDFQQEAVTFWSVIGTITSLATNTTFNVVVLVFLTYGSIVYQFEGLRRIFS